jgi:hypothetical protein
MGYVDARDGESDDGGADQETVSYGRGARIFQVQGNDKEQSGLTQLEPALIGTG